MSSKYYNTMSKIKTDDELKAKIIANLEQENVKKDVSVKGMLIMKIKRIIATIVSILGIFICGGGVYAALGGKISGVPVSEWMGIKFSDNYVDYIEPVENEFIEKDGARIELQSTVCDDGFLILQFDVTLNEEQVAGAEDNKGGLYYLAFNDEVIDEYGYKTTKLGGANYNIIIDGEEYWIRPGSNQTIEEVTPNREYRVYQMYFLTNDELQDKEDFTITLNDVVMVANDELLEMEGNFEVEVSKSKALNDTTSIAGNDATIEYKNMKKSIDKVSITPLQNIVKLSTVFDDVSLDTLSDTENENYMGIISYKVFDQDYNEISAFSVETRRHLIFEDGTEEDWEVRRY